MSCALAQKSLVAQPRALQTRPCRVAPVKALPSAEKLQAGAFAAAAAVLVSASPAFAGVVLEQPTYKKAFQSDAAPSEAVQKAPGNPLTKKAPVETGPVVKSVVEENSEGSDDVLVFWPLGVIASGGFLFGLSKIDTGFGDLLTATMARDSANVGIGNEASLKGEGKAAFSAPYYAEGRVNSVTASRMAGTKVLKKKK